MKEVSYRLVSSSTCRHSISAKNADLVVITTTTHREGLFAIESVIVIAESVSDLDGDDFLKLFSIYDKFFIVENWLFFCVFHSFMILRVVFP